MTKPTDDYEAVRIVVSALEGFDSTAQERILRWAREKVGLAGSPSTPLSSPAVKPLTVDVSGSMQTPSTRDLKTFVNEKNPGSDVQFAATVAYFYRFEAPPQERKNEITSNDLQEACRLTNRERLILPAQTLRNAHGLGLLDKGSSSGLFTINSVGENLVAMTLPRKVGAKLPAAKAKKPKAPNKAKKAKRK
jgi:hypothetical protein